MFLTAHGLSMGCWGQHHVVEVPVKATGEPWGAQPHLLSRRWRLEARRGGAGVSLMPQEEARVEADPEESTAKARGFWSQGECGTGAQGSHT